MDNGLYMGEMWVFELMKDKTFPEAPKYVFVDADNQIIDVFPNSDVVNKDTGIKSDTLYSFNLLNEMFPCAEEEFSCNVAQFGEKYKEVHTESIKGETLDGEFVKIKDAMR